jgi:hypothetical protein
MKTVSQNKMPEKGLKYERLNKMLDANSQEIEKIGETLNAIVEGTKS